MSITTRPVTGYDERLDHTLQLLQEIARDFQPAVLANGFGPESMVLTDLIAKHRLDIDIFSLDTGRLPEQTHALARSVRKRYGLTIRMFNPAAVELEAWVAERDRNAFYGHLYEGPAHSYGLTQLRPAAGFRYAGNSIRSITNDASVVFVDAIFVK